jgi:tetratricopeptide (TPR) repeat protein
MKTPARICVLGMFALLRGLASADPATADQLGTIHFVASGDAEVRAHVVRGVKLLHHMMYEEADKEFAVALQKDAGCAFGYWGRAMTIVHPLWPDVPDAAGLKRGADYVDAGLALGTKSPREQAYLEAIGAYFRAGADSTHPARLKALDTAWADVAERYPDDLDAAAFSALFHLAPARFLPKDKSNRIQLEAAGIIEKILKQIPDHPGALHYKIHAYDFPLLAGRALEVCDVYGGIAPEVPHALHMPTHIFTRRGLWDKSIELNERSAAEARKLASRNGATNSHLPHALDYLAYAYLQRGQYQKADAIRRDVLAFPGPFEPTNRTAMAFAFAAIPARLAVERHDWAAAARLELRQPASFPWSDSFLFCDAISRFARALGTVRSGDLEAGRREIAEQEKLAERIAGLLPNSYWASQAEVQLLGARGWLAFHEGNRDAALTAMCRAVELEATVDKEAVTPGEVIPAGELLGEMLGEMERPREALAAFEAVLQVSPNRFNALYGAAHAAEQAGDTAKAIDDYRQLLAVASAADAGNERIEQAKVFLASRAGLRAD